MLPLPPRRRIIPLIVSLLCSSSIAPHVQAASTDAGQPCAESTGQVAGAVLGALLGGLLGNQVGKGNGRTIATVAGALGGLALGKHIGSEIDRRKCELARVAERNGLTMTVSEISGESAEPGGPDNRLGLTVAIEDTQPALEPQQESGGDGVGNASTSSQFDSGSDTLTPAARSAFSEIARTYATPFLPSALQPGATRDEVEAVDRLRQRRILVVGHTDDTGNSRLNADLSERRAQHVARLLSESGVPEANIYFQGAGETQPVADNRSAEGRARNRRVEIIDLGSQEQFNHYLAGRRTNVQFYRTAARQADAETGAGLAAPVAVGPAPVTGHSSDAGSKASARARKKQALVLAASAPPGQVAPTKPAAVDYDFGGHPASASAPRELPIGKLLTAKKGFALDLISSAHADDLPFARSCKDDRPRVANAVKSLQGAREYHASEYMPGLYGTSWTDNVNGNLVALTNVAVLRDGGAPARKPTLLVYKAARGVPAQGSRADFRATPEVNTYQGENGLLYRLFVDGPVKCMDVVFLRDRQGAAPNSSLYYSVAGQTMVAEFAPKIVSNN